MNPTIKLKSVTKLYGNITAVNNLNLEVCEGEILGLIGPNGAGKTTTLKMMVGLLKPTSGTIEVMGQNLSQDGKQFKQHIGYLPEEDPLYGNMTVRQYLHFFSEIYGIPKRQADDRIDSLLYSLKLADGNKLTSELSKGMKRKVSVARTMLHNPSLLVLDEPNSGLDPLTSFFVSGYLKKLSHGGKTIVLSAHNLFQIESICDRVAIINNGEVYICDTVSSIREKLGKREYEVVFSANADLDYEMRGGNYVFHTENIEQITSLLELISKRNWILIDLSMQQPALEEVYVRLMKDIAA
ncbi:MAG: ABC transporter ATP-binding protein [Dehalococcoidales bacterium]|nr:ABC transporter ATP-binding protein [Dehalococcoidales bacterium]